MLFQKVIYLRSESNPFEKRTPLIPSDCKRLSKNGFLVYVQKSRHRIFSDQDYEDSGAIITDLPWYDSIFQHCLILGLKEFPELDRLSSHSHMFFSHSYRNQTNANKILNAFHNSKSRIYDLEYITDDSKNRLLAFGEYSGYVGAALGLIYFQNGFLSKLTPWNSYEDMLSAIPSEFSALPKVAILGPNGRCGKGVRKLLDRVSIPYTPIYRETEKHELNQFDIVFNCILLDPRSTEIWMDENTEFPNPCILVDISCDPTKPNNPFRIYDHATTWSEPVFRPNGKNTSIIAIDNLPSLLPKESSEYFSDRLTSLFITDDTPIYKSISAYSQAVDTQEPDIYIINFNDDGRRDRMKQRFRRIKMREPHFVDPVFISDPRLEIEGVEHKRTCSIMLQHLDSLQHFLDHSIKEFCIICEDDILISKNMRNDLPEILEHFKRLGLDILLLGYLYMYTIDPDSNSYFSLKLDSYDKGKYKYANYPDDLWGSQMYLVSRKHASYLVEKFGPDYIRNGDLPYNPDWTITKTGNRALIVPMLAVEEGDTKTDHSGQNQFHQRCFQCNFDPFVHI